MKRSDREIIEAWERQGNKEDDDTYDDQISLGPPNHAAAVVGSDHYQYSVYLNTSQFTNDITKINNLKNK
jgi:hypothetical protein